MGPTSVGPTSATPPAWVGASGRAATGTPDRRREHSGFGAARGRACHWAPDGIRLHKAQGGGDRGGLAYDHGRAARRMRGARGWGHRCHQGRRLERGAQSPALPWAAAKDGLDRRAARRSRTPIPHPGARRRAHARASQDPGARISVPSFRAAGVNPGSKAQKLPSYRGVSEQRGPAEPELGGHSGPFPGRSVSSPPSLSAGRVGNTTAAQPPPPGCEMGDWPRRPPRSLPAGDCGRPLLRGPGISLHLTGRRFTTKSPRKLPSQ